jgi:ribonuclease VapC
LPPLTTAAIRACSGRLDFPDCFSYVLASAIGEPVLFKGDDFRHTDVRSAG